MTTNNKSAEPDMPNPVKFMTDSDQYAAFGRAFISRYLAGGFTSLPKREIDLLVLDLLHEQWKEREKIGENTPYEPIRSLAQDLKVSSRRLRSLLDVLSFRKPSVDTEQSVNGKLKSILEVGEKQNNDTQVAIQVSDGYVREYAEDIVRRNLGIVDTSFNSQIIKLSSEQFLLLALEVVGPKTKAKIEQDLKKAMKMPSSTAQDNSSQLVQAFVKALAKGAGEEIGAKTVKLGFALLTGGFSEISSLVGQIYEKTQFSP